MKTYQIYKNSEYAFFVLDTNAKQVTEAHKDPLNLVGSFQASNWGAAMIKFDQLRKENGWKR